MTALLVALVALPSVGVVGWAVWSVKRKAQLLHKLPRTPVRELVAGTKVRVIGTARSLGHDVSGHFSGAVCLACHAWVSTGLTTDGAELPRSEDRVVAFSIEDETGAIAIAVEHVELALQSQRVDLATSHAFGASVIAREGGALGGGVTTYREDRLPPDSRVAAIGYVVRGDDGALRLAGRAGDRLVIANGSDAFIE